MRTARHVVVSLAFPEGYTRTRKLNHNDNLINMYNEATPLLGRIAREIQQKNDIINNSVIFIDDLNKIKAGFTITCKGNDATMQFRDWHHKFSPKS